MQKKTFFYSMALVAFIFALFLPLQGAEAFRGNVERERIPVGSLDGNAAPQPPANPNPVQPSPAEPDQKSGQDDFRYVKMYNRRKDTGFEFPNLEARDLLWAGLQLSTVIGIFPYNDDRIVAPVWMKRPLTERLFSAYNFYPQLVCDVCINREDVYKRQL